MNRGLATVRGAMQPVYHFKQTVLNPAGAAGFTIIGGAGPALGAYSFNLGQVGGNLGPFTSLYDQYCIKKIVFKLIPKFTDSDLATAGGTLGSGIPLVATCLDYDDAIAPAALGDVMQRQNAKLHLSNKVITRVWRPTCNFVVDAAGGGLSQKTSPWLDVTNISVPHFGLKFATQTTPTGIDADYDTVVTYYLAFKQVR